MSQICSFYISNIKNELAYISQQYTEDKMYEMINDSTFLQFEKEDDKIDSNETQSKNRTILNISNHIVQVLIIEKMFNLKTVGKILNKNSDNDDTNNEVDSENSSIDNSNSTSDDGSENELENTLLLSF
ncbi:9195_t:CDS:2 [Rhizophagus irregularis]|nr:9195_t:CDS:2 [Rhizophagus irregularis]